MSTPPTAHDALDEIFNIDEHEYIHFTTLLNQKEYTGEALSFIANHARILHYWKTGAHNLLTDTPKDRRHRRFSFLELVWLLMVKELRDFGMEKKAISQLKEDLFRAAGTDQLQEQMSQRPEELAALLQMQLNITAAQAKAMISLMEENKALWEEAKVTTLFQYAMFILLRRIPLFLLIRPDGTHIPFIESLKLPDEAYQELNVLKRSPHISICINTIVGQLLSKSYINENITREVYSQEEQKLIDLLRKETPKSITVHFDSAGQMKQLDITREFKVDAAARLKEIIVAGGYEQIEIRTQNGKPVYCKKTQTHKL